MMSSCGQPRGAGAACRARPTRRFVTSNGCLNPYYMQLNCLLLSPVPHSPLADYELSSAQVDKFSGLHPHHWQAYWNTHVTPSGGYLNLGCCAAEKQYAVIGLAAWGKGDGANGRRGQDTCYAAHAHYNEEVYWQISGGGQWQVWDGELNPDGTYNASATKPDVFVSIARFDTF